MKKMQNEMQSKDNEIEAQTQDIVHLHKSIEDIQKLKIMSIEDS